MEIALAIAAFVVGMTMLVKGADWLIEAASLVAEGLGVPPLVVGLTIVAFGTSAPELAAAIGAALRAATDPAHAAAAELVVGTIVGSNIANIALILGVAAILRPVACPPPVVLKEMPIMLAAMGFGVLTMLDGQVSRTDGLILFLFIIAYSLHQYGATRADPGVFELTPPELPHDEANRPTLTPGWWVRRAAMLVLGLVCLTLGAHLLVNGATTIARAIGVPEVVIGLTLVAVGTSLPELATSVRAAIRGESDLAVGNIIGSNVFNTLCVLGLSSALFQTPVPEGTLWRDAPAMMLVALIAIPFMRTGWSIGRWQGAALLLLYAAYIAWLFLTTRPA